MFRKALCAICICFLPGAAILQAAEAPLSLADCIAPAASEKRYNKAVIPAILTVLPGIMLLAYPGLQKWMFIFVPLALVSLLLFDRKRH